MNIDLRLAAFLLSLAAAAFAAILGAAVGAEEYLVPTLVLVAFAGVALMALPQLAALGAIATFSSGLTLPGLPGQLNLFDSFAIALLGIFIFQNAMQSGSRLPFSRLERLLLLYMGWLLFIGLYRGFGFLAFEAGTIGGYNYLHLLLAASLLFTMPRIGLSPHFWKPAFIFMGVFAPATLAADLMVTQGFAYGIVRLFVQTSSSLGNLLNETSFGNSETMYRLIAGGPAALGVLLPLLCLVPAQKFFHLTGVHWLVVFAGTVMLSLLSGFRLMTASIFLTTALAFFFQKQLTMSRMTLLGCVSSLGLIAIYTNARQLPNSIQRAISWLPGINVSNAALGDATGTVDWRLHVWRESLAFIPDYWLVGKGFAYNERALMASFYDSSGIDWALTVGSYHNGWLSMILCTGVLGMILGLVFLIFPIIRHWRIYYSPWRNSEFQRYHGVFLAALITSSFVFLTVYGDVHVSFPTIFFQWAVLETIVQADAKAYSTAQPNFESTYQEA